MTDGVIVNRTPESFGMKQERERLERLADSSAMGEGVPTQEQRDQLRFIAGRPDTLENGVEIDTPTIPLVRTEFHVPPHVGETVVLQPHQTAEAARTGQIEQIEDLPEQDPEDAAAAEKANGLSLSDQLTALGYFDHTEFVKFKSQVIACLRHAGFDVKKFFNV
jgi:hypothetical protein